MKPPGSSPRERRKKDSAKMSIKLHYTCHNSVYTGQIATASVIATAPFLRRNINVVGIVYRTTMFSLPNDRPGEGWDLMPGEYRTLKALINAAKRNNIVVEEA